MHDDARVSPFYNQMAGSEGLLDVSPAAEMPIAIVGMSCRFPGDASSPEMFWDLLSNGRSAWSEIPESRFNKDAFYHPTSEKSTTTHVKGGHFLEQDLGQFDAGFFNMTVEMASTMDPQLRILLESVFEALENGALTIGNACLFYHILTVAAGIPLEKVAGTKTSVFAAGLFRDYMDNIIRDPQAFPHYVMTGNGGTMMSNRISHFFDLRGPSMTIDTGCSTGLTALHQACQSLRTRESDISIIGGANLIINPDIHILFSNLGILSPDGRSYSFDSRAAGYGRGEGVSTIILKPLQQALEDGDPVRAVIRRTALNQDGWTQTITSPSQGAQEDLIRACYRSVGLSPADTMYVEAHGTGTATGDPVEAAAIGNVFSEGRPVDKPLFIGSVKTNVGHMESVSGLASILKVAMALENDLIPSSINYDKPNPDIDLEKLKLKVPQRLEQWPANTFRRASISNFGYGGANAHVIMESLESWKSSASRQIEVLSLADRNASAMNGEIVDLLTLKDLNSTTIGGKMEAVVDSAYESASDSASDTQGSSIGIGGRKRLFLLSAKDDGSARSMAAKLGKYLALSKSNDENGLLDSLAYTLSERRSRFPWSLTIAARSTRDLKKQLEDHNLKPARASERPRLGFVFTGQGAQWYGMGRELIKAYPVFQDSLHECDQHLKELGASWSLIEELTKDEKSSRVNDTAISLPLCTAVQISIVRLLASWGIRPTAITSHSSGEVAAAFAAKAIDCHDAMAIVFARGPYLKRLQEARAEEARGGMIAIGLGREDSQQAISQLTLGKVGIAAVNSPSSVTVSGDIKAIEELEQNLAGQKIFARKLKISVAYHSHHMNALEGEYLAALRKTTKYEGQIGSVVYASPVTGKRMPNGSQLTPRHWVNNMLGIVEFHDALRAICLPQLTETVAKGQEIDMIIEIGPHSALAGPIRQTLSQPDLKGRNIAYGSCLSRAKDAVDTMLDLVCSLLGQGYPVELSAVNLPTPLRPKVLHDLPTYPWNHQTSYWFESQLNRSHRFKKHPQHELLGSLMAGTSSFTPTWRNIIRPSDVPWIYDHVVQGGIVYPGAGLMVMAIEAIRQITEADGIQILGYEIHDVDISNALIIPDTSQGVEVQLSLRPCSDKMLERDWNEFLIGSTVEKGVWVKHCKGLIRVLKTTEDDKTTCNELTSESPLFVPSDFELEAAAYPMFISPSKLFKAFQAQGIIHGPAFRNLNTLAAGPNRCVATFSIADTATLMPGQHECGHVIHPTTLDSVLQGVYASLPGIGSCEQSATMPRYIKFLFVSSQISHDPGHVIKSYAKLSRHNLQGFEGSIIAFCDDRTQAMPKLKIDGLFCQALGMTGSTRNADKTNECLTMSWNHDLDLMNPGNLHDILKLPVDSSSRAVEENLRRVVLCFISDTLESLTATDVGNLSWYHKSYYEWMRLQEEHILKHSTWRRPSKHELASLVEEVSGTVDGQLVVRVGKQLVQILRQQVAPLELMLEGQLLYDYYKAPLRLDRCYAQVIQLIQLFKHKKPRASILEIGGGTGGCTKCVLDSLGGDSGASPQFFHYDFTDVSAGFFEQARERFAAWGDRISYKTLDIEHEPCAQGFKENSYDLIIACQVLHATHSMKASMTHVRKLLKPGGKLILVETTNDVLDIQLVFGTLPGWWKGEEQERKNSPSLTVNMWKEILQSTGFSGLDLAVQDCEDPNYVMSVMMSTAKPRNVPDIPLSVAIGYSNHLAPPAAWLDGLKNSFRSVVGLTPDVKPLESVDVHAKIFIFLDDPKQSILVRPTSSQFNSLKTCLLGSRGVLWITSQASDHCQIPKAALSTGFLRTLRAEDTTKRYISLDNTDDDPWTTNAVNAMLKIYATAFDYPQDRSCMDSEFRISGETIQVPRLYEAPFETQYMTTEALAFGAALEPFHQPGRALRMDIKIPGMMDSLYWHDDPQADLPLPDGWVEIEPKAFGLNFRDVMVAMGQLDTEIMGCECSGTITRLSASVPERLAVGARVCCAMVGHWATHVRVHWTSVISLPDSITYEIGASIPVAFLTAYHSLFDLACLEKGEKVLIHSAAGGVGQAAIMLAQNLGAEVFVTVGSKEKRELIHTNYGIPYDHIFSSRNTSFRTDLMAMTEGNGVDVVLNSLAGPLLQATWKSVARFGRFVEIGKRDLEAGNLLDMSPFTRNISFFAVDLLQIQQFKGKVVARALKNILGMINEGSIQPVAPITVYSISDLEKALRSMQAGKHLGKIVVAPREGDLIKVTSHRTARLSSDASYLIVGGVGGIGRSIAHRLVERGARNIILASRTAELPRNVDLLRSLAAKGCKGIAKDCDICCESDVASLMNECASEMPPIKGIIQSAMNAIFENMVFDDYNAAVRPKVLGTWNLHQQSLSLSLDFFIMLSSVCGIIGNSAQCNYAAGNTFQDALARHRTAHGLPGLSLDLGPVKSVGYVSETPGVVELLKRAGVTELEEEEVLRLIERGIVTPYREDVDASQVITGVSRASGTNWDLASFRDNAMFSTLKAAAAAGHDSLIENAARSKTSSIDLKARLQQVPSWSEAVALVAAAIIKKLADMFAVAEDSIEASAPLSQLGVDSLVAVELRNWVSSAAQAEASIFDVTQSSSITSLAGKVARKSRCVVVKPESE
ncbi:MAG: hypothetical protein Q9191_004887 [Dirinaria sp. TL-2023a]